MKYLWVILSGVGVILVGFVFYWSQVRPANIRATCQSKVDSSLASKLGANGFHLSTNGKWTRVDDRCTEYSKDPVPKPGQSYLDAYFANPPTCLKSEKVTIEPDQADLAKDQKSAQELYTPCLHSYGL